MINKEEASRIRQTIFKRSRDREFIEKVLLKHREMITGCLITRNLGTTVEKRKTPSYYLSGKVSGKTVLKYVRKDKLDRVRKRCEAWREFSKYIAKWRKLSKEIEELFRKLGRVQSENPFSEGEEDG